MYGVLKRALDLLTAAVGLLIVAPLLLLLAIAVYFDLGAPVLFRQQRPGFRGKPFWLIKLRTMRDDRDTAGSSLSDAERLTPLGRWLRRTSLDELPELWNVFRGEMSLVGPRPLLMQYLGRYSPEQMRRHDVRPGITGWAQINGRNALTWEQKFALDLWYASHCSFALDLKIIARTLCQILGGRGISQQGHATMPEFHGSPRSQS
ncbi:MAG: sugar transferase [Candidatus Acidiferrales bacterium]